MTYGSADPERAAPALTEAVTRLGDRAEAVPHEIWDEAAKHGDEPQLASPLPTIGMNNLFNRPNVSIRQVAGEGW